MSHFLKKQIFHIHNLTVVQSRSRVRLFAIPSVSAEGRTRENVRANKSRSHTLPQVDDKPDDPIFSQTSRV